MGHFAVPAWADFVRGLPVRSHQDRMRQHLGGCGRCTATVEWLSAVARLDAADARYEPPACALRHARVLFAVERPRLIRLLPRLVARLSFDSRNEPLLAGVRRAGAMSPVFDGAQRATDVAVKRRPVAPRAARGEPSAARARRHRAERRGPR